ncbi:30S ribosomal protein S8e [Candidatus Woesearchaeota archaeon]|nr:30S ribosomal protein S8e [Candidatus Woesearchaeota archaeon]
MVIIQGKSKTKASGKKVFKRYRGKRKYEIGREPTATKLGALKLKTIRTKGGGAKQRMQSAESVNLYDPSTKQYSQAKIKTVMDNPANRNFVRRNILTKGAIVDTEKGKARITSRPGQEGTLNAVLIK